MAKPILSAERLRELLEYNQETGVFTWRVPRYRKIKAGMQAGVIDGGGYVKMCIDYVQYRAHRLAWLYVHGKWPAGEIDHINGVRSDNRIANLRDVPSLLNKQNRKNLHTTAASGLPGAYRCGNKWRSQVSAPFGLVHLGTFETPQAAHSAFVLAKLEYQDGAV